jgi:hypothetical protein
VFRLVVGVIEIVHVVVMTVVEQTRVVLAIVLVVMTSVTSAVRTAAVVTSVRGPAVTSVAILVVPPARGAVARHARTGHDPAADVLSAAVVVPPPIAPARVPAPEQTPGAPADVRAHAPVVPAGRPAPVPALLVREHGVAQSLPGLLLRGGVADARVHAEQVVVEQLREVIARGRVRHRADGERRRAPPTLKVRRPRSSRSKRGGAGTVVVD